MRDHHHGHLPRTRAVAGAIDLPDNPEPPREHRPRVLVAGAAESGPRFYVTRELGLDLAVSLGAEDSAPQLRRRGGR